MSEREKLIGILSYAASDAYSLDTRRDTEELADFLLANGVIVPPCKVGDEVYWLYADDCGNDGCFGSCDSCSDAYWKIKPTAFKMSMYDEIGKTVFLSREDAEKALKGVE